MKIDWINCLTNNYIQMEETNSTGFKPKKSVALSGVAAGNTALSTVGKSGNDLHYRGYDILDLAHQASFEEVAYLLIYGSLPTQAQLVTYQSQLISQRGLPITVQQVLKQLPSTAHAMDLCFFFRQCFARERQSSHCWCP